MYSHKIIAPLQRVCSPKPKYHVNKDEHIALHAHKGLIWVYLNGRCNFACDYCLDGRNNQPERAADSSRFEDSLTQLQQKTGYTLVFTGGEPLIERDLLRRLFTRMPTTPKAIQTNGSLHSSMKVLAPHFQPHDWLAISLHDESFRSAERLGCIDKTTEIATSHGIPIVFQMMCSPDNLGLMLKRADLYRRQGHRTTMRRLFHYGAECFKDSRAAISAACSEPWGAAAFFEDSWEAGQPFVALNVYLDGTIRGVCREEVTIGNLYSGYDLHLLETHRGQICDSVCHCCSCLWVREASGFA